MLNTAPDLFAGRLKSNATTYIHTLNTALQKSETFQKVRMSGAVVVYSDPDHTDFMLTKYLAFFTCQPL